LPFWAFSTTMSVSSLRWIVKPRWAVLMRALVKPRWAVLMRALVGAGAFAGNAREQLREGLPEDRALPVRFPPAPRAAPRPGRRGGGAGRGRPRPRSARALGTLIFAKKKHVFSSKKVTFFRLKVVQQNFQEFSEPIRGHVLFETRINVIEFRGVRPCFDCSRPLVH